MNKPLKRLLILLAILVVALIGWAIAGPYLAMHGIHQAIKNQDMGKLERHVDFERLRTNLRPQIEDRLAREIGRRAGSGLAGSSASAVAGMLSNSTVDAMVSPTGIAILLQGHALKQRVTGNVQPNSGVVGEVQAYDPLENAKTGFESPSSFVASVHNVNGQPVDFIFERKGLHWRLSDIRLPRFDSAGTAP